MRRNMSGNLGLYKYLWPGSVYTSAHTLTRSHNDVSCANNTAWRLLFALGWHFIARECDFFLEIFEFENV